EAALQQAPEVFQSVGMDISINVLDGMVNDLMEEFSLKSVIGCQRVSMQGGPSRYATLYQALKGSLLAVGNDGRLDYPSALQESHDCGFVFPSRSANGSVALVLVHVPRLATNERFVDFY